MQRAHQTPGTHAGGPAAITAGVRLLGRWAEGEEVSWPTTTEAQAQGRMVRLPALPPREGASGPHLVSLGQGSGSERNVTSR